MISGHKKSKMSTGRTPVTPYKTFIWIFRLLWLLIICILPSPLHFLFSQETTQKGPRAISVVDAVRSTLLRNPFLLSQQVRVHIARGALMIASSPFDGVFKTELIQSSNSVTLGTILNNTGNVSVVPDKSTSTIYSASYTQLFRNGISIAPTYQASRDISGLIGPGALNASTIGFSVTIPILRGRGRAAVAAQENASRDEISADELDLRQTISQLIRNTASDYWRLVAAQGLVSVAQDAESRGKTYVDNTQALVNTDQVPRNDLHEVVANLADRASQTISAQALLRTAALQVASDMGSKPDEILRGIDARDDFPNSDIQAPLGASPANLTSYFNHAIQHRADYQAALRRSREQHILLKSAQNGLLPLLNFALSAGYSQAQPGTNISRYVSLPSSPGLGPNVGGSLTLSVPFRNRAAAGNVLQTQSALKQADLTVESVAQDIAQSVGVALEGVRSAALRVQQSETAVREFETSLAGARQKYQLGFGSIVEILTIEDRLTGALAARIQARLDYALALTQFRYSTGTLFEIGQSTQFVPDTVLMTLPSFGDDAQ
jgi:outer membrane protein